MAIISRLYGRYMPISQGRELTKTDQSGTTAYGIILGSQKVGLDAECLQGNGDELLEGIRTNEIKFPFIAQTLEYGQYQHFVVVLGIKRKHFIIIDPARGKIKIKINLFFQKWSGYIITFLKNSAFEEREAPPNSLIRFYSLLRGQYHKLIGIFFFSIVVVAIEVISSFVFELVIDNYVLVDKGTQCIDIDSNIAVLYNFNIIFISIIILYLVQMVIQLIRGKMIIEISKKIDISLTMNYYRHILNLPYNTVVLRKTGEYLSRLSDVSIVREAISSATLTIVLDTSMVVGSSLILYIYEKKMFFVSILMILFYTVIIYFFKKPIENLSRASMEKNADIQSFFKESIDGIETIKNFSMIKKVEQKGTELYKRLIELISKNSMVSISQDSITSAIEQIGSIVILWIGFSLVKKGQLSLGSVITFYALLTYFTEPIKNLIQLQPTIQSALVAADRINDILDLQIEELEDSKSNEMGEVAKWSIEKLYYSYYDEVVLKNVSFSFHQGEKIAIVGKSGSGKSTLLKTIIGLIKPTKGKIMANGTDIQEMSLSKVRQEIAYVGQAPFLFAETIRNNLTFGIEEYTEDELNTVCQLCEIDKFVKNYSEKLEHYIDENGNNLSAGQKQKIAIARALLRKPQLLLLDEATTNLDIFAETKIWNAISKEETLSIIMVAHRLSHVKECDRIFVLDGGKIVESGTHDQLVEEKGLYYDMWINQ